MSDLDQQLSPIHEDLQGACGISFDLACPLFCPVSRDRLAG
jgi:hypothetical protein